MLATVLVPGTVSVTDAPVAFDGPLLLTTIVYVIAVPAVYVDDPSVLLIARSVTAAGASVSVAVLLVRSGSVCCAPTATVAVFTRLPVVSAFTVPLTTIVR